MAPCLSSGPRLLKVPQPANIQCLWNHLRLLGFRQGVNVSVAVVTWPVRLKVQSRGGGISVQEAMGSVKLWSPGTVRRFLLEKGGAVRCLGFFLGPYWLLEVTTVPP